MTERVNDKTATFNDKIKILEEAENKLKEHNRSMDEWKREYPDTSVEDLIQHGKSIAQPALDYYTRNFKQEAGDIYKLKRASRACQVFNPFVLKQWDLASLELLIDDLVYFEYRHFTANF